MDFVRLPAGLLVGGALGLAFGAIQDAARRRHERLQLQGRFRSGWAAAPGSFRRVGFLMAALAVVQLACPVFFEPGSAGPWFVSAGVVAGYGWTLLRTLRQRRS